MFPKFSREFAWLGKMQKAGKFSSESLFFPLPYAYAYLHSALENSVWRSFAERTALVSGEITMNIYCDILLAFGI
jgi:hypothetical protein